MGKGIYVKGVNFNFQTDPVDGKDVYEIRNAAVEKSVLLEKVEFQGSYFTITTGDYDGLLNLVVQNLGLAKNHAANENEVHMLECYIESFSKGSLDAHKVSNYKHMP